MQQKPNSLALGTTTATCVIACLVASAASATPFPSRAAAGEVAAPVTLVQGSDDAKRGQKGPPGKGPNGPLGAAARELGISESALADAVGPAPPNIERGAKVLGIPPERLRAVLEKHRPPAKK